MSEWISVADRLPEGKEDVLCVAFWHEAWQTMVGWYSDLVGEWRIITPIGEKCLVELLFGCRCQSRRRRKNGESNSEP